MQEIWKLLYNRYKVSNTGRVFDTMRNRELKLTQDKYGYLVARIVLDNKAKVKKVHRLVAEAFLGDYNDNLQVNHKDENKTNNLVSNLEMCTNYYNCNYGSRHTKLAKAIEQYTLDGTLVKTWTSVNEIRKSMGYNHTSIIACCKGILRDSHNGKIYSAKSAYGFVWKYKDNNKK